MQFTTEGRSPYQVRSLRPDRVAGEMTSLTENRGNAKKRIPIGIDGLGQRSRRVLQDGAMMFYSE